MPPSLISEVIAKESENQFYNFVNGTFILFYFLSCNYSPPHPRPRHTHSALRWMPSATVAWPKELNWMMGPAMLRQTTF